MRRVALIVLLSIAATATVALAPLALAGDKEQTPFKPGPASSYPGAQTLEKITIAAVPYDTAEKAATAFGKVDPYRYGILPVLVVIENNTGKALRLDLQTQFVLPDRRHADGMPPADVVLYSPRKGSWKVSQPSPIPIPISRKK